MTKNSAHNVKEDLLRVKDILITKLLRPSEGRPAHCVAIRASINQARGPCHMSILISESSKGMNRKHHVSVKSPPCIQFSRKSPHKSMNFCQTSRSLKIPLRQNFFSALRQQIRTAVLVAECWPRILYLRPQRMLGRWV